MTLHPYECEIYQYFLYYCKESTLIIAQGMYIVVNETFGTDLVYFHCLIYGIYSKVILFFLFSKNFISHIIVPLSSIAV